MRQFYALFLAAPFFNSANKLVAARDLPRA